MIEEVKRRKNKLQVIKFQEELERLLKRFNPYEYAFFVSQIIEESFKDFQLMRQFPLHFLLHSIEENCAFHRSQNNDPLDLKKLHRVIGVYINYYDPISQHYLADLKDAYPWLISTARQQFYLQITSGYPDLGRSIEIFCKGNFGKAEAQFLQTVGLNYTEWLSISFCIHSLAAKMKPCVFTLEYLVENYSKVVQPIKIESFLNCVAITPIKVKETYHSLRKRLGEDFGGYFDLYLRSIFLQKPLIKNKDKYLIVHKELFLTNSIEGLFDLQKSDGTFGQVFGRSFENYVGKVVSQINLKYILISENELQKYTSDAVCDYLLVCNDYILLIECKGTEYSSYISSVNAMQKDNSTRKIVSGINQLISTGKQIVNGVFFDLIGDIKSKPLINVIVTFKHLYFINTRWYWDNIYKEMLGEDNLKLLEEIFNVKTQIFSIDEFEKLIVYLNQYDKSMLKVFQERIKVPDAQAGDWQTYLSLKEDTWLAFLKDTFHDFVESNIMNKLKS